MKTRVTATELDTTFDQTERQRKSCTWLVRALVGFGVFFLLMVAVTVTISLLVNFLPQAQKPTSAWKYASSNKTLARNHQTGPALLS